MKDISNYSLKTHNTFGIDATCSRYLEFGSTEEAKQVASILRTENSPYIIIGGGSNLLLTRDYAGIVVRSVINGVKIEGCDVSCGSGVEWDSLVEYLIGLGLYGAENLSLIPGDVGASAVQNIGAYGVEAKDLIVRVWCVEIATGEQRVFSRDDCAYGYRYSRFKGEWRNKYLITRVDYRLSQSFTPRLDYGNIRSELVCRGINTPTAQQMRETIIAIRQQKLPDPKVTGNAGSFFMNPVVSRAKFEELAVRYPAMPHYTIADGDEKIPAGWLIEQCGWKGRHLGRAGVHPKQALVLVNLGGATGHEIVTLCNAIRDDVRNKFGIDIHPEVNIV